MQNASFLHLQLNLINRKTPEFSSGSYIEQLLGLPPTFIAGMYKFACSGLGSPDTKKSIKVLQSCFTNHVDINHALNARKSICLG
jgi:hypothetical protein